MSGAVGTGEADVEISRDSIVSIDNVDGWCTWEATETTFWYNFISQTFYLN